jgi:anthranilate synthase component 2
VKVLILDNYDSFTHNLAQLLGEAGGTPVVVRNDAIDLDGIARMAPDRIVISPGPGTPERERDFGICGPAIDRFGPTLPILGVCLGLQGIVHRLGGRVVRAPVIVHGKASAVRHDGDGLFEGIDNPMQAMRYHSLMAERATLPACLRVTAETVEDGLVMAVAHREWPLRGVQFHPESIGTPQGKTLLANFLRGA